MAVERNISLHSRHFLLRQIDTAQCIGVIQRGLLTGAYFDGDCALLHDILAPLPSDD